MIVRTQAHPIITEGRLIMMFDTLNIEVSKRVCGEPLGVSRYIDVVKSGRYERNGVAYIVGRLDNYIVYADEKRVTLSGSVAKLVQGENVNSPSREQVQEGVLRLSDALHINVGAGRVMRVDVASTLNVENEPAEYLGQLVSLRNATRVEVGTGAVYFEESGGKLCFYDKRAEVTKRNGTIPREWACFPNLLRYEKRCLGDIRGCAGTCRVDELTQLQPWRKLVCLWADEYGSIVKPTEERIRTASTPRAAMLAIFADLLRYAPEGYINEVCQLVKAGGKMSRFERYRLRKELRKIVDGCGELLVDELTQKIEQVRALQCA